VGPLRERPRDALEFARRRVQALRKAVVAEVADINRGISHVLRGGVLVSVGVLLAGLTIAALEGSGFSFEVLEPGQLLGPLLRLQPAALLSLGVLILILTPVARVALSLLSFLRERDRRYVEITTIVLLNLLVGFLLGIA